MCVAAAQAKIVGPEDVYVKKGSTISLTCIVNVQSTPPSSVSWHHGGDVMDFDSPRYKPRESSSRVLPVNVPSRPPLLFHARPRQQLGKVGRGGERNLFPSVRLRYDYRRYEKEMHRMWCAIPSIFFRSPWKDPPFISKDIFIIIETSPIGLKMIFFFVSRICMEIEERLFPSNSNQLGQLENACRCISRLRAAVNRQLIVCRTL